MDEKDLNRRARKEDLAPSWLWDWPEDEDRLWLRSMTWGIRGLVKCSATITSSADGAPLAPDPERSRHTGDWYVSGGPQALVSLPIG
jgi:hypothetical protein